MKSRMQIAFADVLHAESMSLPKLGGFQDCYTGGEWSEANMQLHVHAW